MQLAPFVEARILDAYVDGKGLLEVRLFGSFPLVRAAGPDAGQGELMRYLAELVWAPQAMLYNSELSWRVVDETSVEVSAASPAGTARMRLLFEGGDVVGFEADDRPRLANGRIIPTRWRGDAGTIARSADIASLLGRLRAGACRRAISTTGEAR